MTGIAPTTAEDQCDGAHAASPHRYRSALLALLTLALLTMAACSALPAQNTPTPKPRPLATAFAHAAQRYGVPQSLLIAIAYVETRWDSTPAGSSYGPMGLYSSRRHDGTLDQASKATGVSTDMLKSEPAANIEGAAAVLAGDARALNSGSPPSPSLLDGWYAATARYAGIGYYEPSQWFADYVFAELAHGLHGTAADGETLSVGAQAVQPDVRTLDGLHLPHLPQRQSEYPNATAVVETGVGYGSANRPNDGLAIRYIVIHDTEESYLGTMRVFTDPDTCCAAHYVVDGADTGYYPTVTQFVAHHDVAYHAGDLYYNRHAIGIEHVGFANAPDAFYTQAMYDASARLVAYLCLTYQIPIDRAHILGHDNVPSPTPDILHHQHWDPGSYWDWPYYLARVRADYIALAANAAPPAAALDAQYQRTRKAIRAISVNAAHADASDIGRWGSGVYASYTPVFADAGGKPGSQLVRGASDPATARDERSYDAADFSCDNAPEHPVGDFATATNTSFDLRAKAGYAETFALLGAYTAQDGTIWDKIDFNGVAGWVRDADTTDGWGEIVTFGTTTTVFGDPTSGAICDDTSNGFSRAGQSYVAQEMLTDDSGKVWYAIYYNHRVVWVPAREVTPR